MKEKKSPKEDSDMQNVKKALVRASQRARELAAQTGTEIVVIRDGKLVREVPPLKPSQKKSID